MTKQTNEYSKFLSKIIIGIGEVSDITGVSVRKIRYWEDKGIIVSVDSTAKNRQFDLANIKKIVLIQELIEDGYTLDGAANKVEKRIDKIESLINLISL